MVAELIARYGYVIVLLGTFFEGETVVVIAGYAAHRGHLSLPWVMVCSFVGSLLGDQLAYWLGRRYAPRILKHRPKWRPKITKVRHILERHAIPLMLGFRFVYGIRTVTPFTIGWTGVPLKTFAPLNTIGAAIWAVVIAGLGYAFGGVLTVAIHKAHRYEEVVIAIIAVVGVVLWARRRRRLAREEKLDDEPGQPADDSA